MKDRGEFDNDEDIVETVTGNLMSLAVTDCSSKAVDFLYRAFDTEIDKSIGIEP